MIIAINCRLNKAEQPEGYADFLFGILGSLTAIFPQHQFLYIFDKPYPAGTCFTKLVTPMVAGPETKTALRLQYWLNYKIPAILRKHKVDVFVSLEGICSLRTKTPQCLVLSDFSFMQQPQLINRPQGRFYKKHTAAFLAKAKSIATVSTYGQSLLADQYRINTADMVVINPGIDSIFKPMAWDEKNTIQEKYTGGKAYFLFSGNINQCSNTINLLKAFTFFKARQKSNMMLVIAGLATETFKKELRAYKFRSEVVLLENLPVAELAKITATAYAMVYPVLYDDLALAPLQAMQSGIPIIVSDAGSLPAIFGEAAIYCNATDFKHIAETMMLIFKDEDKAAKLVQAGYKLVTQFQYDSSAELLMQSILKCAE